MFFENSVHSRWGKKKFPIFAQNPVSQSRSLLQGGGFKVFDARGREILLHEYLKKLFRKDIRYVGSAPERLFVTTYSTSVRRKRVNRLRFTRGNLVTLHFPCRDAKPSLMKDWQRR